MTHTNCRNNDVDFSMLLMYTQSRNLLVSFNEYKFINVKFTINIVHTHFTSKPVYCELAANNGSFYLDHPTWKLTQKPLKCRLQSLKYKSKEGFSLSVINAALFTPGIDLYQLTCVGWSWVQTHLSLAIITAITTCL